MFDVDFFKIYNDTFGHLAGDNCLRKIIKCIAPITNKGTVEVYRFGGDEFIILIEEPNERVIKNFLENLILAVNNAKIEAPKYLTSKYVTISVGASTIEVNENYSYINQADRNLYECKEKNKGKVCYNGTNLD